MKKIFIFEDDPRYAQEYERAYHDAGWTVAWFQFPPEHVEDIIVQERPNLIQTDINMPGMDGIELTHLLKQNPSTNHIPIFFLTNMTGDHYRRKAIQVGATAFFVKGQDNIQHVVAQADALTRD